MTYITYTKTQHIDDKIKRFLKRVGLTEDIFHTSALRGGYYNFALPPKKVPSPLPKPDFMPRRLVRTSNMKVVKGSKVREGYCALSYSWNQSGEIKKNKTTGNMERNDQGKHKIVYPGKIKLRTILRDRKRIPGKVKLVTFKGLIQEICKDFGINYIWYDQMCINQNNKREKRRGIRQMHEIYKNASYTIALVPELTAKVLERSAEFSGERKDSIPNSLLRAQWMKRMWTLEETILSPEMLLIGNTIHCWKDDMKRLYSTIFSESFKYIPTILHYAHSRSSTKKHDRVFALANIFPDVIKHIKIDYKKDIHELMIEFYGLLAKKDLAILFFGPYKEYKVMCKTLTSHSTEGSSTSKSEYSIPIREYNLPSWTGVNGEHFRYDICKTSFKTYTVNKRVLQVTCFAMTNDQHHAEKLDLDVIKKILPPFPENDNDCSWSLVLLFQPQGSTNKKVISIETAKAQNQASTDYERVAKELYELSHFMPIKKTNLLWTTDRRNVMPCFYFDSLTEPLEDSAQYALLTGVPFRTPTSECIIYYPVVKKEGYYYKAIGMCRVEDRNMRHNFLDDIALQKQTFKIH